MIKQRKKSRYHQVLFDDDLPFKGKREAPKKLYNRKEKHRKIHNFIQNLDNTAVY